MARPSEVDGGVAALHVVGDLRIFLAAVLDEGEGQLAEEGLGAAPCRGVGAGRALDAARGDRLGE